MRMKAFSPAWIVAGGLLALGHPSTTQAQVTSKPTTGVVQPATNGRITVAGEFGGRGFAEKPNALELGKFEEYRDMRAGPRVEQLIAKYTPADSFNVYSISARKLGYRDQSVWLQVMRPGKYDFQLRWDRIPHTYSTTARSPGNESTPGFNTLPTPRPDSLAWRNASYLSAVRSQSDPIKVSLNLTPTDKFDFKTEYLRIRKTGAIPLSISFNASTGPQREFVGPIDQTMHDLRFTPGYASGERKANSALPFVKSYQLLATYDYSRYLNGIKSIMVDNPQLSVSSPTLGAASSRVSMPPDNTAHTLSVIGALGLPARTRLMGTVSSSWMYQNDLLLSQTVNDSLKSNVNYGLLALPRSNFDAKVRTSVANLSATSNPIDNLSVMARYRNYQRDYRTAPFHINAMAISDRSINTNDSATTEFDPFTKTNADLSAHYQLIPSLSLTAAYAWENWARDHEVRNTARTKEKGPRVSLDYNGVDWLSLHASYSSATRRGAETADQYRQAGTEILDFRRFDQADRDRSRTNLLARFTPRDNVDLTFTYMFGDDKFPHSLYGTQSDKSSSGGFDLGWTPFTRVTLSAGYEREDIKNILNTRLRTGTAGSVTWDNPTYKWSSTNKDKNTTTYANVSAVIIPDKLDFLGNVANNDAHFWVFNRNAATPTGGTAAQNLNATTEDWPEVKRNLKPVTLALRYFYSADWAVTLRYQYEHYTQTDFRTSMPLFAPFNGAQGLIPGAIGNLASPVTNTGQYHFLGSAYLPYTANWFALLVSYQLPEMPFSRARSTF